MKNIKILNLIKLASNFEKLAEEAYKSIYNIENIQHLASSEVSDFKDKIKNYLNRLFDNNSNHFISLKNKLESSNLTDIKKLHLIKENCNNIEILLDNKFSKEILEIEKYVHGDWINKFIIDSLRDWWINKSFN